IPWSERPLLQIRRGKAEPGDQVSLTPSFAGIAETGTLMLTSGPATPSTLNFLPDTHIVVLRAEQVVPTYEEGWTRLRARQAPAGGAPAGRRRKPPSWGDLDIWRSAVRDVRPLRRPSAAPGDAAPPAAAEPPVEPVAAAAPPRPAPAEPPAPIELPRIGGHRAP